MNLDNLLDGVVHYLFIKGMTCLGHHDDFLKVSAPVCMITNWTRPMVNHDTGYQVIMIH